MIKLINELDNLDLVRNTDWHIAPWYYDSLLQTFYKSEVLKAIYYFNNNVNDMKYVQWHKFNTHSFKRTNANDFGTIGITLDGKTYFRDNYFDIALVLYKYRHLTVKDKVIIEWFKKNDYSANKAFVLMHIVGMMQEHKSDNREEFLKAFEQFNNIDWSAFDPAGPFKE